MTLGPLVFILTEKLFKQEESQLADLHGKRERLEKGTQHEKVNDGKRCCCNQMS